MKSYHVHIGGQGQGVGFRPYVCQLAESMSVKGWISNSNDGGHIEFSADEGTAMRFYQTIIQTPPFHSIITLHHIEEIPLQDFLFFSIKESSTTDQPNVLLTPDIAICEECSKEVMQNGNRWSYYPF